MCQFFYCLLREYFLKKYKRLRLIVDAIAILLMPLCNSDINKIVAVVYTKNNNIYYICNSENCYFDLIVDVFTK